MEVKPSSDYISRIRFFTHEIDKEIVYAYVEGDDDIPFWTYALKNYSDSKYEFRVVTNKMAAKHVSVGPDFVESKNDGNGKAVLLSMKGLGKNKIACVDADFDLVINGYSLYTNVVRTSPFVLNTIYYSVENVLGSPQFRSNLLEKLHVMEFANQMADYIKTFSIYCRPLLTLCMSIASSENKSLQWTSYLRQGIPLVLRNIAKHLSEIDNRNILQKKFSNEYVHYKKSIEAYEKILQDNNISIEDSWKMIRGHNLFESCILKSLESHIKACISSRLSRFATDYNGPSTDKKRAIAEYRDKIHSKWKPTTSEYIKETFYCNMPSISWLPNQLVDKIHELYG